MDTKEISIGDPGIVATAPDAPTFERVVRHVPMPQMLGGPKKQLGDIAEDQTAALGRIATATEFMAQCSNQTLGEIGKISSDLYDAVCWFKAMALVQTVTIIGLVVGFILWVK